MAYELYDYYSQFTQENEPDDVPQEELPTDEDLSDIVKRHKEEDCEECHGTGQVPISSLALAIRDLTNGIVPLTQGAHREILP